jgi:hypothetical protein
MLRSVTIRNFKPHSELALTFDAPITVIIGPNNVGKSAVLQALAVPTYGIGSDLPFAVGDRTHVPRARADEAKVEMTFDGFSDPLAYRVSRSDLTDNPPIPKPGGGATFRWANSGRLSRGMDDGLYFLSSPNSPPRSEERFRPWDDRFRYVSATRGVPNSFNYHPLDDEVGPHGENTGNILQNLLSEKDPRFDMIEDWVKRLGIRVDGLASTTVAQGIGAPAFEVDSIRAQPMFVGSGTVSVLPVVVQGVLCGESDVLLLEEPESSLHRGALNGLWLFLKECSDRGVQVVITSHSSDFLVSLWRRFKASQIPDSTARILSLTRDSTGGSSYVSYLPSEIEAKKSYLISDLSSP